MQFVATGKSILKRKNTTKYLSYLYKIPYLNPTLVMPVIFFSQDSGKYWVYSAYTWVKTKINIIEFCWKLNTYLPTIL